MFSGAFTYREVIPGEEPSGRMQVDPGGASLARENHQAMQSLTRNVHDCSLRVPRSVEDASRLDSDTKDAAGERPQH